MVEAERQGLSRVASFEALLAAVAARLLAEPLESFDACVTDALSRLVDLLQVDRATLSLIDPADGRLSVTHAAGAPGVPPIPIRKRPPTFR